MWNDREMYAVKLIKKKETNFNSLPIVIYFFYIR